MNINLQRTLNTLSQLNTHRGAPELSVPAQTELAKAAVAPPPTPASPVDTIEDWGAAAAKDRLASNVSAPPAPVESGGIAVRIGVWLFNKIRDAVVVEGATRGAQALGNAGAGAANSRAVNELTRLRSAARGK